MMALHGKGETSDFSNGVGVFKPGMRARNFLGSERVCCTTREKRRIVNCEWLEVLEDQGCILNGLNHGHTSRTPQQRSLLHVLCRCRDFELEIEGTA